MEDLLTENNEHIYRTPLTLIYNRTLPNRKEAVKEHWEIMSNKQRS